jgi:hypothetical protein
MSRYLSLLVLLAMLASPVVVMILVSGCGSGELDRDVVTNLPPGDATGTDHSGEYQLTIRTKSCDGRCPTFQVWGFTVRICSPGNTDTEQVTVTQTDGVLEVTELGSSMYVQSLRGGVNTDGTFDVGGYEIQQGTEVGVAARVQGQIDGSGRIQATARVCGNGSAEGETIACTGTFDVTGLRQ